MKIFIYRCNLFNENLCISLEISVKFVPDDPINNNPASDQVMAWAEQAQAITWTNDGLIYWRIYASLGHNDLKMVCVYAIEYAFVLLWFVLWRWYYSFW